MTKTMILGKDAALEDSISRMKNLLSEIGFDVEEASWLNPVPHVWSLHLRDKYCPMLFTNGKGASQKACLASAIGEFFERLNCNYFFADFYLGEKIANAPFVHYPQEKWFKIEGDKLPKGLLDARLLKQYNPSGELTAPMLVDTQSGNRERGIVALPFVRQRDQETVYIPMNIVGNLYVSNGMSAGNTPTEARVQALSEIFERAVKNRIISEGLCLPDVPKEVIAKFPHIEEAIKKLEDHGYPILVKDASLGGKYPVMNVTLLNPNEGTAFCSYGGHPKFEVALERTLTELLQGRSLNKLDVFSPPTFDMDAVKDTLNLEAHFIDSNGLVGWDFFKDKSDFDFVHWNFKGQTTSEEYETLLKIFHEMDKDVYVADYEHLGVYGCRILVPGMSEIYQADDLVWENNNSGIDLRAPILGAHKLSPKECFELMQTIDEKGYDDMMLVTHALGIVGDAGTGWAELRFGELKAMLALAAQEFEAAKTQTEWLLHFAPLSVEKKRWYLCLDSLLQFKLDDSRKMQDYFSTMEKFYGQEMTFTALEVIEAKKKFVGLHETSLNLEGFTMHQKLITSYEKLQKAKALWAKKI
ncbi:MAG: YcaO-like family protein [Bacteriovoracaceae bacterium]|nr:YcaO-like family protein [Bacteriovoracaceae bacterium]